MLTQAEIDALLAGSIEIEEAESQNRVNLAEMMGEEGSSPMSKKGGAKVRPYNFWSPDHFSKDQMRAVELIHEDLAERLTSSLPPFIQSNLRPRVVHTEQGRFHDFLKDLPNASLFHMITLAPLPGQFVLTVSPEISYIILEQRLGGQTSQASKMRNLTEIDQFLLREMIEHILNDVKASWSKVVSVEPSLEDSTVNQHWVQMVMGNERVMLIAFELALKDVTGTMNLYIPFTLLKPIISVLNTHVWFSGLREQKPDPNTRRKVIDNLSQVTLPVRVFLGSKEMSFKQLTNLKLGDVIPLANSPNDDMLVQISDQDSYLARIGRVGNRIGAQITERVYQLSEEDPLGLGF